MYNESWLKPSYEDIHNACHQAAQLITGYEWQFHRIMGISRGGFFPAMILSHMLKIPVTPVVYSSKVGAGDDKNHHNVLPEVGKHERLLIVDDICDTGNTLYEIKSHYELSGMFAYTFALYYKSRAVPVVIPDFKWRVIPEDSPWVIFPYERNEHIKSSKEAIDEALSDLYWSRSGGSL